MTDLRPHPGPQASFHRSAADIAIFGGAAGPGKSWSLIFEPTRLVQFSDFRGVIFRRLHTELIGANSVWEYANELYRPLGGVLRENPLDARFRSGASIEFNHLQLEKTVHQYQSKGWEYIAFDELVHFSERQFWYLLSRNRSISGRRPFVRAATNPDADSWVRKFIDWWIGPDGLPIPERSGVKRWVARDPAKEELIWADSRDALNAELDRRISRIASSSVISQLARSVTFIGARLEDNPTLMTKDPTYAARLELLPLVERERLRRGNWNVKPAAGLMFKEPWFGIVETPPLVAPYAVRAWDLAGTEKRTDNSPAWTVGSKWTRTESGAFTVIDVDRFQGSPYQVEQALLRAAKLDGPEVAVAIWRDPGQAGKAQQLHLSRLLAGYNVRFVPATENKITYALPYSAQCENGNVSLVRGSWNKAWIEEHVGFPDRKDKDQVDSGSLAIRWLTLYGRTLGAQSS